MGLTERENYLRTARLEGGEWIPCSVGISSATWIAHREELEKVALRHPLFFPGFKPGPRPAREPKPERPAERKSTDAWGCVWDHAWEGIQGQVVEHPLADWGALADYRPPDPMTEGEGGPANWEKARESVARAAAEGRLTMGHLPHGFLLMRLWYLRGFEALMGDLVEAPPELPRLIELVADYARGMVAQWLSMKVDAVFFPEDLGMQTASILSPALFRRWILPSYRELMGPCREAGCEVYLHSDGYIMELVDDLLGAGVTIINPQDLCNGIEALAAEVKGRACIALDVDRQTILPFGTRREIRELIREEVMKLGSPRGGLMLVAGIYPPTPPENVDALYCAMEEFRTYWWDGRGK
jgi:hypothetical protein